MGRSRKSKHLISGFSQSLIKRKSRSKEEIYGSSGYDDKHYYLTPKGVLYSLLAEEYGIDPSLDKLDRFEKRLVNTLSSLATNNADMTAFGVDFNDMIFRYVTVINMCAKMKQILDDNGIDFNDKI